LEETQAIRMVRLWLLIAEGRLTSAMAAKT
jgi:hypothetical protein